VSIDDLAMSAPSPVLDAVLSILADGKPRTAEAIFDQGMKRGLFGATMTRKHIYTALTQYIQRTLGRGNKPLFVQDPDRSFRLNRPIDDWPDIDTTGLPPLALPTEPPASAAGTIAELRKASSGSDPDAYERAVCAALELFGFASTHVGGNDAPDGYADALLGELGYRVMLECKLSAADHITHSYSVAEAAKYRDAYSADYCALIAPTFNAEMTFVSELKMHGVAAWTTDDLVRAATMRMDCSQMRELFAPGYAADLLDDLAWAYVHGPAKRLRVVASLLVEIGLEQQRMAHTLGDSASVPRLTADVALSLIDDRLASTGCAHGVTREEIDAGFTWLASPYVARAIWASCEKSAIIIRQTLRQVLVHIRYIS
jgi:hypothetical protein